MGIEGDYNTSRLLAGPGAVLFFFRFYVYIRLSLVGGSGGLGGGASVWRPLVDT